MNACRQDWATLVDEDGPVLVLEEEHTQGGGDTRGCGGMMAAASALAATGQRGTLEAQAAKLLGPAATAASGPDALRHAGGGGTGAVGTKGSGVLAEGVTGQQGMSWRERAQLAKQRKAEEAAAEEAARPPPEPVVLQLSWRDKARAAKHRAPAAQ